jgi:Uma2 family endonuclease
MAVAPLTPRYTTYEDLRQLPEDGHRYELFDGEVHLAPSPSLQHQRIVRRLTRSFEDAIRDGSEVFFAPLDVVLARATALQPDLLFVRAENRGILQGVIHGAPDLVVEVLSPSTAEIDRGIKRDLYARHGISEYWLVDPASESIEILRLDAETGAYQLASSLHAGEQATTTLLPALSIDLSQLFQP